MSIKDTFIKIIYNIIWYLFYSKLVGKSLKNLNVRLKYNITNNEKESIIENRDIIEYIANKA